MFNIPLAYFISFRTYGSWLHGDARGSVTRTRNQFGTPLIPASRAQAAFETSELRHPPTTLGTPLRLVVEAAVRDVCAHNGWGLHAINVRSNHVHVIVTASDAPPERAMNAFKAWATRRLRENELVDVEQRMWSRHGSTIYLFTEEKLAEKIRYVNDEQ